MVELIQNKFEDFNSIDITNLSKYRTGISLGGKRDFQKIFLMSSYENYILMDDKPLTWKLFWKMVDDIKSNYEKL